MEIVDIKVIHNSFVEDEHIVSFRVDEKEAHEVMRASLILERYKALTLQALGRTENDADWQSFEIRQQDSIIQITHKSGMTG